MPRFRYTGWDISGRQVAGERDAADADALRSALATQLSHVAIVEPIAEVPQPPSAGGLPREEAREVSGHIAEIIQSQLPLESGLAAIAAECASRRVRRVLNAIADDLGMGRSLEAVLARQGAPPELKALVRAGARSGNTGQILEHYVLNVESAVDLRRSLRRSLLYPCILMLLFGLAGFFVIVWIVPQFAAIFAGFNTNLPAPTKWLINAADTIRKFDYSLFLKGLVGIIALLFFLRFARDHESHAERAEKGILAYLNSLRLALGDFLWHRIVGAIPLVGPILRWTALARFSQLLSLLVENQVPLDEALTLAGQASNDPQIRRDCRTMVAQVTAGETLESAARQLDRFPASFVQALTWASRPGGMPEILQSLGDMYAGRVRAAAAVLVALLPPLLMVLLGLGTALIVVALFLPLFSLINLLS